jgi:hypothetical protein
MRKFGESVMGWLPRAGSAALLLLIAACGSAYQQSPPLEGGGAIVATAGAETDLGALLNAPARGTEKFGYFNQQVSPTSYKTLFLAKYKPTYALTLKQRNFEAEAYLPFAYDMAILQAAKIALDNGYAGFTVAVRENFLRVVVQNDKYSDPAYRKCEETCQTLNCGCVPTYHDYATLGTPAGLGTYGHYDLLDARVLLSYDLQKEVAPGAYDAKEAIAKLHEKYGSLAPESQLPPATAPADQQAPAATPESEQKPAPPADIPPQNPAKTE